MIRTLNFKGKNRLIRFFYPTPFQAVIPYFNSKIIVDTSEHIGWNLYWNGGYEKEVIWILDKCVNKDSVCVDIGANMGVYSIPLAEKSKKVICFEPHPGFRNKLKTNLEINDFQNVEISPLALSDKSGEAILHSPPKEMTNKSATLRDINSELTEDIKVKISTLDEEVKEQIDFIKIDTDGSDGNVILGGKELIKKYRPVILFEYLTDFQDIKDEYGRAIQFLTSQNYHLHEVRNYSFYPFRVDIPSFTNVIAIPQ